MNEVARAWFARNTSRTADWELDRLLAARAVSGATVSVVIPARNEAATIGPVVAQIRTALMEEAGLVDELVVMDSLSTDATAEVAADLGAQVHSVADVRPDLGVRAGKGEALWKSQFVTGSDVLVFIDADLTAWGPHFVSSLMGPLLEDDRILLVRGFYDRILDSGGLRSPEGGRVTELVARPLLAAHWPELSTLVQPLAGEWSIRNRCSRHCQCQSATAWNSPPSLTPSLRTGWMRLPRSTWVSEATAINPCMSWQSWRSS